MNIILISQVVQVLLSIIIVMLTLIQSKGVGLSSSVGSSISFYRSRRGLEKGVFILTIIAGVLLVANSLLLILLR